MHQISLKTALKLLTKYDAGEQLQAEITGALQVSSNRTLSHFACCTMHLPLLADYAANQTSACPFFTFVATGMPLA